MAKRNESGAAIIGAAVQQVMTKPKPTPVAVTAAAREAKGIEGKVIAADMGTSKVQVGYAAGTGESWRSRYHSVAVTTWRKNGRGTPEQIAFACKASGEPMVRVGQHVFLVTDPDTIAEAKKFLREHKTVERMVAAYGTAAPAKVAPKRKATPKAKATRKAKTVK